MPLDHDPRRPGPADLGGDRPQRGDGVRAQDELVGVEEHGSRCDVRRPLTVVVQADVAATPESAALETLGIDVHVGHLRRRDPHRGDDVVAGAGGAVAREALAHHTLARHPRHIAVAGHLTDLVGVYGGPEVPGTVTAG